MESEIINRINNSGLNLTVLEKLFLKELILNLYAEQGFSDIDCNDLSRWMNVDITSVRGVASSLIKKKVIFIDEDNDNMVYLDHAYYSLHPSWS